MGLFSDHTSIDRIMLSVFTFENLKQKTHTPFLPLTTKHLTLLMLYYIFSYKKGHKKVFAFKGLWLLLYNLSIIFCCIRAYPL